jgi:penicillin-binding protein 1B
MALKIKFARPQGPNPRRSFWLRMALMCVGTVAALFLVVTLYYYFSYRHIVDERLKEPIFASTAKIYAAPREVRPGQKLSTHLVAEELRSAGYSSDGASNSSQLGTFAEGSQSITIRPGPQSFHAPDPAVIHVSGGTVSSITDQRGQQLASYELEPQLITGLSEDANRTKRRLIAYDEIPQNLVNAVIAIEDRRFFEHGGVNYMSMLGWAWHDVVGDRKHRGGASTVTMQLAKQLFVTDNGTFRYKLKQVLVAYLLENRFSKQQIFESYANQVPMGQRGSFSINGFGEASQAYFGKDVRQVTLSEAALMAGLIQSPSRLNPFRHPERAIERRNVVLDSMVEVGAITKDQDERAKAEPLHLIPGSVDASEAPYFVDLVHDQIQQKLGERDFNREGLRIYTSLDPDLQKAASAAVESSLHIIDDQVDRLHAKDKKAGITYAYPQVALVALDPHTGQVLALVGGRSYGQSQVNHAVSHRPTGSIFKPFVYASAFATAVEGTLLSGQSKPFSPVTMLSDEQTTYDVGGQSYTAHNFEGEYHDQVTARYALMRSLNNATIGLASMVGFDRVAALARDAGIKAARGTPTVAIGAYDASPLDMAGAYTVFANKGLHIDPWMLSSIRTSTGDVIADYTPTSRQVLDPRVAYLTTSLMQDVINGGTAADVRRMGFTAPAAGKTGTSHDAWFAGFTSNLLCIVWVGNDDYTDIKIEGAHAAAPIWAAFMKNAVLLPQYSDTNGFAAPDGVDVVKIDKDSNMLSDDTCPDGYNAAFLSGTAPTMPCDHPAERRTLIQKIFGTGTK